MEHICEDLEISLNIYSNANLRTNMLICRMYKHDESYNIRLALEYISIIPVLNSIYLYIWSIYAQAFRNSGVKTVLRWFSFLQSFFICG